MNEKIYPFKFLDAYTRDDKPIFFGRDEEIQALYDMIFQTDLLVVYGASGTGKSSLIQCGLANKFQSHDWMPISVRRGQNINDSLATALQAHVSHPATDENMDWLNQSWEDAGTSAAAASVQSPLARTFKDIYLQYFRPIFLIFDQFEELYVLGTPEEQEDFIKTIQAVLKIEQPIKILISIREEYLGYLYDFEKAVPELLRKKLRVEPMNLTKVSTVIEGIATKLPNSLVTLSKDEIKPLGKAIFEKIKDKEKTLTIQLPYLQVFLDKFYLQVSEDENRQTPAHLTMQALSSMGDLGDILRNFLDNQVLKIAKDLQRTPDEVWQMLSPMVTLEGTKEPMTAQALAQRLRDTDHHVLTNALQAFVSSRILRLNEQGQVYEVAHDALAKQIHAKRSDEEIAILEVQRLIKSQVLLKEEVRDYFTEKQLDFVEPYLTKFTPSIEEADWLAKSRTFRAEEKATEEHRKSEELTRARETAERERHLREAAEQQQSIAKVRSRIAVAVAVVAIVASGLAWWQYKNAEQKAKEAKTAQEKAQAVLDKIYFYEDKFGLAYDNDTRKYGFIDKDLKTKIVFKYEEAFSFDYTGFAKVKKWGSYYLIDTVGYEYGLATDINQLDPSITALDLRNKNLSDIPPSVFKQRQLKVLLLKGNNIQKIPEGMKALHNLLYLELSDNEISKLENLDSLTNLVYFNISTNQISRLEDLDNLKALQQFNISGNLIKKLEGLDNLKNLQQLTITHNKISKLEGLDNLINLVKFDISNYSYLDINNKKQVWNQISNLEGLDNLEALQQFNISGNLISNLEGLDNLKNLQNFNISRNLIGKLEILDNLKNLQIFDISSNPLALIKEEQEKIKKLMPNCKIKFDEWSPPQYYRNERDSNFMHDYND